MATTICRELGKPVLYPGVPWPPVMEPTPQRGGWCSNRHQQSLAPAHSWFYPKVWWQRPRRLQDQPQGLSLPILSLKTLKAFFTKCPEIDTGWQTKFIS
jgi:hypothetical protein